MSVFFLLNRFETSEKFALVGNGTFLGFFQVGEGVETEFS